MTIAVNCNLSNWEIARKKLCHFTVLNIHIRSLQKNFDKLHLALGSIDLDFQAICITETWITDTTPVDRFAILGKSLSINTVLIKLEGELAFNLENNRDFKPRPDLDKFDEDTECIFAEINVKHNKNLIIGSIYGPPQGNIKCLVDKLSEIPNVIRNEKKIQYIMGDFNINLINFHIHTILQMSLLT